MGRWTNKAFATRAELQRWNNCLELMKKGHFEPEIVEMITDAERENEEYDMMTRAIKIQTEDVGHV